MATSGRGFGVVGYNVQVAVDTEHHLIVAHEVTNSGSDRPQLANMAKQAKAVLQSEELAAVADRGYFNSPEILECVKAGHHRDIAQADDVWREIARSLWQARLCLCAGKGCLSLSGRRAVDLSVHSGRARQD